MKTVKVLSCFAGIGGFDLGFERNGFEVVGVVEKDAKCRKFFAAPIIAFSSKDHGADAGELSPTLRACGHGASHANGGGPPAIASRHRVRRMTPLECERIMGFPDGHTLGFADGPRYKMLGNAVVVSCSEWIARRMKSLHP